MANPMTILSFGALFAGLGVTSGATGDAALVVLGVLLGSTAWWIVLTTVVARLRTRVTPAWIHRINVGSGVIIGAFAIAAIVAALSMGLPGRDRHPTKVQASATGGASEKRVSWRPAGASRRALSVSHGVRVASATSVAPPATSTRAVAADRSPRRRRGCGPRRVARPRPDQ